MDDPREIRLLNEFQRDFPLVAEPYAAVARALRVDVEWVLARLAARVADGTVSRVGAVFRPGAIGVSTLAALAVDPRDLTRVAALVSSRREVNHNYEREHRFNLWFVVTAPDSARLDAALAAIERDSGFAPISLPLVEDYAIDLGFDFTNPAPKPRADRTVWDRSPAVLSDPDRRLIAALEDGLPVVPAPWAEIARRARVAPAAARARVAEWLADGIVKRFGVIVRHRALGYVANAMCVWDVPDAQVTRAGHALACEPGVTLCYRRERARPEWPYNLFCMIHGQDRALVEAEVEEATAAAGLAGAARAVLFSRRCFKQRGARYATKDATPAWTTPTAAS